MNDVASPDHWREPVEDTAAGFAPKFLAEACRARRRRREARLLGLGALLVLGGALAAGGWRRHRQQREAIAVSEQLRNLVPSLRVATVKPANAFTIIRLPATTSAFATASVFARATGYIVSRHVDIGDYVRTGQLLAEIRAPELDHQIAQAEATLGQLEAAQQQAQANVDLAHVTFTRNDPLVRKGWFSQQQGVNDVQTLKAQQAALGVAQANVIAQRAQLRVLRQQKAYQRVNAPFDGIITQRNVDIGSLVQADATSGTFMFSIVQSDIIRAQVFVPQDLASEVSQGIEAILHVPEVPDRAFPGRVTRTANAVAPDTRTLLTEVDIPNPDGRVMPGTYCIVELRIPGNKGGLRVPAEAIILEGGTLEVAVVHDGIAHIHTISVARDLGTEIEAAAGVASGDRVLVNPPVGLADGARISIRSEHVEEPR
jgi:RND family efflux transporter MFP subunit